ncbi:DUF5615 family PIN-like protein [Halopenitus persicus]|uniref:DUF5615 family PIN-like protein n=1 Tax=Halopenitus persicus TaxID=1048396 RepID=UPI000BBB1E8C|nr:DUF5615 family PIN-like protein [Halopenitus persicus]
MFAEHVGRIFEGLLRERDYDTVQAKDQFGERTKDAELLQWYADEGIVLLTTNAKDFEDLHPDYEHAGILVYFDQELPDTDPEGLARTVDEVFRNGGTRALTHYAYRLTSA